MTLRDHGYYKSHGRRVSKIIGTKFFAKTGIKTSYHLFDEELASVDLFVEPESSLDELYARRARQLREEYDYLILAFSGGTDSEHVFRTFYKNGIRLDEIFHYHYDLNYRDKLIGMKIENETYEHEQLSLPLIKLIKDTLCPDIEITIVDHTKLSIGFYERMGSRWHEKIDPDQLHRFFAPSSIWRADVSMANPKWQQMLDSGKRVALILAKEKLEVMKDERGWYFQYSDAQNFRWLMPPVQRIENPMSTELFYTHPSTIEMQVKQAHTVKANAARYPVLIDKLKISSREWDNSYASACYGKRFLPLPFLSLKERDWAQMYGSSFGNHGASSKWFLLEEDETWHKNWKNAMHDVYGNLGSKLFKSTDEMISRGLESVSSIKHYFALNDTDA